MKKSISIIFTALMFGWASATLAAASVSGDAILLKVSATLAKLSGYQSGSRFTLYTEVSPGKTMPAPGFDVSETVERPNRLSLVTTQDHHVGLLVLADGYNLTVFNAPKLVYAQSTVGTSSSELLVSLTGVAKTCLSPGEVGQLDVGLTMPYMFYQSSVAIIRRPPGVVRVVTATHVSHLGVRAVQVIQSFVYPNKARIDYALVINPLNNLPLSFSQYAVTPAGIYLPLIRQDFTRFVPLTQALPASGYAFVPPPGSVEVAN